MALNPENQRLIKFLPPNFRNSGAFFQDAVELLRWGDLSGDPVMDIGCGPDSYALFSTLFPNFSKVIAIDVSEAYIHKARLFRKSVKMDYYVADITKRSSLAQWESSMSKVVSFYCFNCFSDQRRGFENISYLLKPGGEAVILIGLKNPHYDCAKYILSKPKWKRYEALLTEFPNREVQEIGIRYYEDLLKELNFETILCMESFKYNFFPTEEAFKESEITHDRVIHKHLPLQSQEEFKEEYFQALIALNGRASNGDFRLMISNAKIIIRKYAY